MISLIVLLALGLLLGVFAIQNNTPITVNYGGYILGGVPLYAVVIGSMLIGVFLSWILSLFGWASTSMQLMGKNKTIRNYSRTNEDLEKRVTELEAENGRLSQEKKEIIHEQHVDESPVESFKEKVRHTFST